MTPEHQKEAIARAYVHAIAAQAGLSCSTRDFDYGIDLTLNPITSLTDPDTGRRRLIETGIPLDIQLKSTTRSFVKAGNVIYDLEASGFNNLCTATPIVPRILVLFVMRENSEEWIMQTEHKLSIAGCCYWTSLEGRPCSKNSSSVRIRIPMENVFCVDSIEMLLQAAQDKWRF